MRALSCLLTSAWYLGGGREEFNQGSPLATHLAGEAGARNLLGMSVDLLARLDDHEAALLVAGGLG